MQDLLTPASLETRRAQSFVFFESLCLIFCSSFVELELRIERSEDASTRLELKEQSEKGRLSAVKEKTTFKRFDLFSLLAVLGILAVLGFQSLFIFELYNKDTSGVEPYLPEFLKPVFASPPTAGEASEPAGPAPAETVPDAANDAGEPAPVG